jgi:hypothetical protein
MTIKIPSLVRRAALAAAAMALSATASATCPGYYCTAQIETMTITETAVYIRLVGGTSGLTNCTPYSTNYLTLLKSNTNYGTYYATLLAAYMAKESVTLRPNDGSTNCIINYIQVP